MNNPTYDTQFYDRYTELHCLIKDLLLQGVLKIPHCTGLLSDMKERQFVEMDKTKIKMEPKEQHRKRCEGRSPDFLDTLVYLFDDFPSHLFLRGKSMVRNTHTEEQPPEGFELSKLEKEVARQSMMHGDAFSGLPNIPARFANMANRLDQGAYSGVFT